jgi:regulator of protease activity HflC (stomatin/prohibitin superfamily)
MDRTAAVLLLASLAVAIVLAMSAIKRLIKYMVTIDEGSRGVAYKHGIFQNEIGPGAYWALPGRKIRVVDLKEQQLLVPIQEVLSADRLPVKLSALATYKVLDPRKSLETSSNGPMTPLYYAMQLAIRDLAAELPLEELIDQRTKLDAQLLDKSKAAFAEQGCELIRIALRDVVMSAEIRRLASDVVRAKMEAAAALERARGEQASLRSLANAARMLKGNPELMNLRVLQSLSAGPGKAAPTIILSGGAGIVPVPQGPDDAAPPPDNDQTGA